MAGFVSKQPNGLYCRFSSVTDCPTAWNMTREDYINMKMQEAKEDAEDVFSVVKLKSTLPRVSFSEIIALISNSYSR